MAAYNINDPRTREHTAYKISQDNAGRAARRYKYGDNVDAEGTNDSPDEADNHDSMETRLANAREARGWAFDEATRRYEWNGQWTGGVHEGVEAEADKRMEDVARWNGVIEDLERQIDHANDAAAHAVDDDQDDDDGGDDEDEDGEYNKNMLDAQSARAARHDWNDDEECDDYDGEGEGTYTYDEASTYDEDYDYN